MVVMTLVPALPTRPHADPAAVLRGDTWRITVLADGLLRLEHDGEGRFEDRPSTFALVREQPVPWFRVIDRGGHLELVTERLRLTYDRGPFSPSGLMVVPISPTSTYHSVWRYGVPVENLGGTARTLDQADGPVPLGPGVASQQGVAVLDDSTSALLGADGLLEPRRGTGQDLYVFAYGSDHAAALQAFYAVSGPTPLLPRWALGNWWSRYHRYTAAEYLELLDRFEAEGLPFSVAVLDMDWHLVDVPARHGNGWTGYTWNRELFADPAAFLAELHRRGLRVTLNVHPADGVRSYEDAYQAMCEALGRDPRAGDPIAFDVTDRQFLEAYLTVLHRRLEADGVDFWWLDWQSGPYSRVAGIDPLWVLNHVHYLDGARDGRRALTLSRYAGPGSHRYPIGFSGDTAISWASLDFQPYFTATAANIGYGWWSHDIGGHMFGARDDELATRWVQLGVFSPINRLHSTDDPFGGKEPWRFGPAARAVQTRYLQLRARLVPYLHTMNHRAAAGIPLVRPMYHTHPGAPEAYRARTQFWFGSELLVAPITTPADPRSLTAAVRAWLPPGTWVDLPTGLVYDGDRELVLRRDLTRLPVLARAGAIVPLDGARPAPDDPVNPAHLEVLVVVGADGAFELVEDDGVGDGGDRARHARTRIEWHQQAGRLVVGPLVGNAGCVPERRTWTITFVALAPGTAVHGPGGEPVTWSAGRASITVPDLPTDAPLELELDPDPSLAVVDLPDRVFALLERAQIEFAAKRGALAALTADRPLHVRLGQLAALGLDRSVQEALLELLLARG
jgi:alpha-glucosidase (family GH31 glycosyl hydrolase)